MGKLRILHVAQSAGGVDRYLQMLLKYLDREKFDNIVVLSQDFKRVDYEGLVEDFETVEMHRAIGKHDLSAIIAVRKLIKKYRPDIVYAHSSKAGAIVRVANIGLKNHCVYNPHGWSFNIRTSEKKKKIYTLIERMAAPFCEKIICISEAERKSALEKKVCSDKKINVIFNGIDIDYYESKKQYGRTRSDLGIPENAFVIGMVGRLCPQKAPDIFIKSAKKIKAQIPEAFFVIVGNGEEEDEVKKFAKSNGLIDCLLITGWVKNPMSYVELFDVALLLSRWEGFGLVLPEYMLAKKPIIATNVDAIPNIITDRENGLLVQVDDVESVYKAVLELKEDSVLRNRIVKNGYVDVHKRFDAKRVADEHEKLFLSL